MKDLTEVGGLGREDRTGFHVTLADASWLIVTGTKSWGDGGLPVQCHDM